VCYKDAFSVIGLASQCQKGRRCSFIFCLKKKKKKHTARGVAQVIANQVILEWGGPTQIESDQRSKFTSMKCSTSDRTTTAFCRSQEICTN